MGDTTGPGFSKVDGADVDSVWTNAGMMDYDEPRGGQDKVLIIARKK